MVRKRRQRNMRPELLAFIRGMYREGHTAAEIYREMLKPGAFDYMATELPSKRTVEYTVQDFVIEDKSGQWSVADMEPEDARIVLDVLANLIFHGRERGFTKYEAAWVLRVSKLAPGISHNNIWGLTQSYMLAESKDIKGEPSAMEALNAYLAFKPWESKNRFENYKWMIELGRAKQDPEVDELISDEQTALTGDYRERGEPGWNAVDEDNGLYRFGLEQYERRKSLFELTKLRRIREKDPELYQKLSRLALDGMRQQGPQWGAIYNEWKERLGGREMTPEERREMAAQLEETNPTLDEYNRLMDSFKEEPIKKTGKKGAK